jgi:hypothetical protein
LERGGKRSATLLSKAPSPLRFAAALHSLDASPFWRDIHPMTAAEVETQKLAPGEKIALMEKLWGELAARATLEPPSWHEAVLAAREEEWQLRETVSEDWESTKQSMKDEL